MIKVLIADDEPIAVEAVAYMIKNNFPEMEIVGTSHSGKDAIEKAYNLHPEMIIMDINMPGINGLEAMKQIRKVNQTVCFIVISAFDYFDYAVESVALGVEEYLLKPVKRVKFIEAVNKVVERIEEKRENFQKNLEQQEKLEMIVPVLESGFMNSLCLFEDNTKELQNYCELFGYSKSSGYVMALEFGQKKSNHIENKIGAGVHGEKMYEEYKKIIQSTCTCVVGPIMLNRIIVYVFDTSEEGSFQQKTQSVNLAETIIKRVERIYPDIFIGIGCFHNTIIDAKKSYQEALHALRDVFLMEENKSVENKILHVDDIIEGVPCDPGNYEQLIEEGIYSQVIEGNEADIQSAFEQIYWKMNADKNMDMDGVKNSMMGLVIGFSKRWSHVLPEYYNILSEIITAQDEQILYRIAKEYLSNVISQILAGRQKKAHLLIDKANRYIEEHYSEDISLDDVAKEVNLSSYYFSRFYKEESGINFSDKLLNVRMEQAKELLKKEELSIKDVAFMVGYMEANYFSKIFKKVTGVTASEYKKMYGLR